MKIGIVNPFSRSICAETELAKRMLTALARIGHEGKELSEESALNKIDESFDFILIMHPKVPKLTNHLTYGCLWSPPEWYWAVDSEIYKNIKSYDGYFVGSDDVEYWINAIDSGLKKPRPLGRLLPSACDEPFRELDYTAARLFYIGSNWDGRRHEELFTNLSNEPELVSVYGSQEAWGYLGNIYKGEVECDGKTVSKYISEAGIGLCFNHPYHNNSSLPSMRIFETIFSSAVVISDYNPFVLSNFGDSVLYVDANKSDTLLVEDILNKVRWVRNNPAIALRKAREAHSRASRYALEAQLKKVILSHDVFKYNRVVNEKIEERKLDRLYTELKILKGEKTEIERSITWRLSKPIREMEKVTKWFIGRTPKRDSRSKK